MLHDDTPYGNITWVLCVPDLSTPNRIVPYLHQNRGTVWFSEPQYIDRFLRENPTLPPGARSRAILDRKTLHQFATDLVKAGVERVYFDLEYGKDAPGERLAVFARRLEQTIKDTPTPVHEAPRSMRFRVQSLRRPG